MARKVVYTANNGKTYEFTAPIQAVLFDTFVDFNGLTESEAVIAAQEGYWIILKDDGPTPVFEFADFFGKWYHVYTAAGLSYREFLTFFYDNYQNEDYNELTLIPKNQAEDYVDKIRGE